MMKQNVTATGLKSTEPAQTRIAASAASARQTMRLAYFVSHPIQYQAPLLKRIASEPGIDLTVFFSSDRSVRGYYDVNFGRKVHWDIQLLDGYKYEFLPGFGKDADASLLLPLNYGIGRRLKRGQFDAVWVHGYHTSTNLQAIVAARRLRLPVFVRNESTPTGRRRSRLKRAAKTAFFRWIRPHMTAALAIGTANEEYWKNSLGEGLPIFRVPYAVDNEFFQCETARAAVQRDSLRQELGLEPERPVILFASKLMRRKRCIDLIEAYLKLKPASGGEPDPYLLIIGDGEERDSAVERIRASGCSSIHMLGFKNQTELPRYFDLCDVFVLPSVQEPWGLIVNEVMNAGRPVIVSDQVGCHRDLVKNGVNGYVFPAGDIDALSQCLRQILDEPGRAKAMGESGLEIIRNWGFEEDVAGLREALHSIAPSFPRYPAH